MPSGSALDLVGADELFQVLSYTQPTGLIDVDRAERLGPFSYETRPARRGAANHQALATGPAAPGCRCSRRLGARGSCQRDRPRKSSRTRVTGGEKSVRHRVARILLDCEE